MPLSDWYLLCFVFGLLWSIAALLLGSFHLHGYAHGGHVHGHSQGTPAFKSLWSDLFNTHSIAIFLAWFGGCGYLLSRHSRLALLVILLASALTGLAAAFVLVAFLRFLATRENPMDPLDYEMVGVLGRVASAIREGGTGEILFARDGIRRSAPARSEDGMPVERGTEIVVTRYEKGIAYVRTWEAMTQSEPFSTSETPAWGDEEAPKA